MIIGIGKLATSWYTLRITVFQIRVPQSGEAKKRSKLSHPAQGLPGTADELLDQLAERLCCEGDFPHEIGVFLGYPLADVIGFIQNRGKNFTACGYWKVYTDPTAAQAEFDRYKKCERIYARCYYNGTPIRRLTVAA